MLKGQHKYSFDDTVFNNIDTKEKAYWHGFLSADGFVVGKNKGLGISLSVKDEYMIDRLILFFNTDGRIKAYRTKKDKYHCKNRIYRYCGFVLYSEELVLGYLQHLNAAYKKATRLTLPDFSDNGLNLAWMLGYYDGDGSEHTPRLSSSSHELLIQIKEKYGIDADICTNKKVHVLYLGKHFMEMLCSNYEHSMERKRVVCSGHPKRKKNHSLDNITRMMLSSIVKTHSCAEIAKMFNVSRVSIFSKLKRLGVEIPKRKGGRKALNSSKIKRDCVYFPCHEGLKTCEFCYCPIYHWDDCCGDYVVLENGWKDCSGCLRPHREDGYDYIIEFLKRHSGIIRAQQKGEESHA